MDLFKKLPNSIRYPFGIEWPLLKKLPVIFLIGTLLLSAPAISIYIQNPKISAEQYKTVYLCFGLLFTFWFFVGAVAIGCVVVMIMKGPGYVADAYELPEENKDLENPLKNN
jgi:hypothetical protein